MCTIKKKKNEQIFVLTIQVWFEKVVSVSLADIAKCFFVVLAENGVTMYGLSFEVRLNQTKLKQTNKPKKNKLLRQNLLVFLNLQIFGNLFKDSF